MTLSGQTCDLFTQSTSIPRQTTLEELHVDEQEELVSVPFHLQALQLETERRGE